ncbi:MAG: aspartyl/glutamyl-tRNA amidotransferase subunit C [Thaumarchaeota archaeon]|nr:MAG: aspartyl/glutamyl-tRNA amidotransferase subunit C [Nitrososphaerota archaeon]TLX90960.1 MAG: aspartyl/glutamyl-tRNA amidotransferase subunit C [Nitrososphaerota archaeon]
MISKVDLAHLAQISKIDLSEEEIEKFPMQLERTIEYIDVLEELSSDDSIDLDLQEIKFDQLRDDLIKNADGERISKNLTEDGYLKGPKMK